MDESGGPRRVVLSPAARNDIRETLIWSQEQFGKRAAARYRELLKQALRDIAADPERPGSQERRDLASGVRTYHLLLSRDRARGNLGAVKKPRHFLVYRSRGNNVLEIIRVLHDARDLVRHLAEE
ncbi:MAG TPA: type II toxin-antitoxin system RelE/ParE family toxin [Bryobacteraceae bacterium]|nr:type II toxin-antitoxin system RelE/ParE family toxin [Bryobacteraceae bacterium]